MDGSKTKLRVLCPVKNEKTDKTYWMRMGVAFPNRDGSTNVILDALPVNGKLQIREWEDEDRPRPEGANNQSGIPF